MIEDIGFVFIYIATFGISDLIVEQYKFKGIEKFLYYIFCLFIGLLIVFFIKKKVKQEKK